MSEVSSKSVFLFINSSFFFFFWEEEGGRVIISKQSLSLSFDFFLRDGRRKRTFRPGRRSTLMHREHFTLILPLVFPHSFVCSYIYSFFRGGGVLRLFFLFSFLPRLLLREEYIYIYIGEGDRDRVNERLRVMKMSVRGDVERAAWKG